jgi:hypothetical protein
MSAKACTTILSILKKINELTTTESDENDVGLGDISMY